MNQAQIDRHECPAGERHNILWSDEVTGFGCRAYPTGRKTFIFRYREPPGGRAASVRILKLGDAKVIPLRVARQLAKEAAIQVALGESPAAKRDATRADMANAPFDEAIGAYERSLKRRGVVRRATAISTLKNRLAPVVGRRPLSEVRLVEIVRVIEGLEDEGRDGAASDFRKFTSAFFSFLAARGDVPANPMAGYRRPRTTRSERLSGGAGRALEDEEIKRLMKALKPDAPFDQFILFLLMTGQRRGETAMIARPQVEGDVWIIPPAHNKAGHRLRVPLAAPALRLLARQPKYEETKLYFPGRFSGPMSGWAKRQAGLNECLAKADIAPVTFHDFRRTFRTGLSRLGIATEVAELCLGHVRADLLEAYDRDEQMARRRAAHDAWAAHLVSLAPGGWKAALLDDGEKIVSIEVAG
ncbi:MAG: integrase family protein [Azospirillaceae bacterium]